MSTFGAMDQLTKVTTSSGSIVTVYLLIQTFGFTSLG